MATIAVVTGTRAEYGLLKPVLEKLYKSGVLKVRLLVTGAHLSPVYGNTIEEIKADGSVPDACVDILSATAEQGRLGTALRTAAALQKFTQEFTAFRPDGVLLLGDRYEIFAVAQAAALLDIPVAHISGGDVTTGADDDWFRHCITKMAKLHFPSCEEYRQRVIRMGEEPWRVFNVGGLGDENIRSMQLMEKAQLEESLSICLAKPYALVTFHPETACGIPVEEQIGALLQAVDENPQLFYIFTMANADAGGQAMNLALEKFCAQRENAALFSSLGVLRYLSAMKHAALVLGNSSSGVVETPSFGVPTVNIGKRQDGRMRSGNIIDCPLDKNEISQGIAKAATPEFNAKARKVKSPYNGGETSGKIVALLEEFVPSGRLAAPKIFYDGE